MLSRLSVVSTRDGVSLLFPACTPAGSMNSFSFRSCDKGPWSLELRDPELLTLEASTTFGYQVGSDQNATTLSRTPTFWINYAYLRAWILKYGITSELGLTAYDTYNSTHLCCCELNEFAMARNCSTVASPQAHHFSMGRTAAR